MTVESALKVWRIWLILAVLGGCALPARAAGAQASPTPGPCVRGTLPHGALSLICVPAAGWNGELVIWAHGYVAPGQPLDFYHLAFADGLTLPLIVQILGYAFATTSYRTNGLAVLEGVEDIRQLAAAFPAVAGRRPARTYLLGASQGALIVTLLVERAPHMFSGGLAACGPIGDFPEQLRYVGDFRVLFDYFFPGVIPGSPISIPREVTENWESRYVPAILRALADNPRAALELMATAGAPFDAQAPAATLIRTTLVLLWYNLFGTNDAVAKLGGNPYGNQGRQYRGSSDDVQLNARVARFTADPAALVALARYQTSGNATIPLVTLHTTGDEVVPFWQQVWYSLEARLSGQGQVTPLPAVRYGHCNFTPVEILVAFAVLVWQVSEATGSSQ